MSNVRPDPDEFIREKDTLKTWSKLIAVRSYKNETDLKGAVDALVEKLEENSSVLGKRVINKDDEEYLVDFMIQTNDVFEFNIFRYVKRNGILFSYQFAYAARTDRGTLTQIINQDFGDVEDFTSKKNEWIDMMTKFEWVDPKIAAK